MTSGEGTNVEKHNNRQQRPWILYEKVQKIGLSIF